MRFFLQMTALFQLYIRFTIGFLAVHADDIEAFNWPILTSEI